MKTARDDERFDSRTAPGANGCIVWTGRRSFGYGVFTVGSRPVRAHRWNYERHVGPIPPGLVLDHLCRNPPCVNPAHLEAVTPWENTLRGVGPSARNARKTICDNGHEFTKANTMWKAGARKCRTCARAENKAWRARTFPVPPVMCVAVTRPEVVARSGADVPAVNAMKTHCKHGHEFTPENTRITKKGRDCRACARRHSADKADRRREARRERGARMMPRFRRDGERGKVIAREALAALTEVTK